MAATAIVVLVPELAPLVGPARARYAPDAARGMPPHVTLLYPFADADAVTAFTGDLERTLGAFAPFDAAFTSVRRWRDTLYLAPEPAGPFCALTEALVQAFPQYPPYGGAHAEIVPHLTVAHGDADPFDAVEAELAPALPVAVRVERAWLMEERHEGWRRHTPFPLNRR